MMGLFDTHAHLYDKAFDRDREEVIHHIFETLDYVVIPSEDLVTSEKAVALAESHPSLYAAVGIHPQVTRMRRRRRSQPLLRLPGRMTR